MSGFQDLSLEFRRFKFLKLLYKPNKWQRLPIGHWSFEKTLLLHKSVEVQCHCKIVLSVCIRVYEEGKVMW